MKKGKDKKNTVLIYYGLPLFLLLALAVSMIIYRQAKEATIRQFNLRQILLSGRVAAHLEDYLHTISSEMEKVSREFYRHPGEFDEVDVKNVYTHLYHEPVDCVYIDKKGIIKNIYPYKEQVIGLDMSRSSTYQDTKTTLNTRISSLYKTIQGFYAFYINVPIIYENRFAGIIGSLLALDPIIEEFIVPIKHEGLGIAWIVDQEGNLLFTPEEGKIGTNLKKELQDKGLTTGLQLIEDVLSGRNGLVKMVDEKGEKVYVAYHPISLVPDDDTQNWGLAVSVSGKEVLSSLRWLYFGLAFLFLATMITSLGGASLALRHQQRISRRLRESNESLRRFSQAVRTIGEAVLMTDLTGIVIFANEASEKVFGISPGELTGRNIQEIFSPVSTNITQEIMKQTIDEGFSGEVWHKAGSEAENPSFLSSKALVDYEGKPYLAIFIFLDIRDIKKAQEEADRRRLELESHLYTISHDLKAPLVTIRGYLDFILEEAAQGKKVEDLIELLGRVRKSSLRMQHLIENILEISRAGLVIDQSKQIPLGDVLTKVLEGFQGQIEEQKISLSIPDEMPDVYADPDRLFQVMENLLSNAVKFMGDGKKKKTIEINWQEKEKEFIFSFKDNGVGIDPKYHEKVFEPFYRIEHGDILGSGIGLTIVRRIIEQHGGQVWLESDPGKGSTFFFTLPKMPPPKVSTTQ